MIRLGLRVAAAAFGVTLMTASMSAAQDPPRRLVPPVRGEAAVEITAPDTKVGNTEIVTTIRVKNVSNGNIAGLRVQENWYDRAGNASAGDSYRHPRPLPSGEAIIITLRTPRAIAVGKRNQYQFSHANGTVKPTTVKKIDIPKTSE
ncbi:MAG: hypothetical protein ACT4QD_12015 [Acidobacteriota bacterium]